jgi:large subunit ribosomal protein L17
MRHRKKGRKLGRTWSHKKAMLRNMVTTFLDREQIETTDAKAKEVRSLAERLVTLAKRGPDDLAARRQALRVVRDKKVVAKLFSEIAPRYADRPGGYTRIVKVENRRGDSAPLSMLAFVTEPVEFKERKNKNAWREGPLTLHAKPAPAAEEPVEVAAAPTEDEAPSEGTPTDEEAQSEETAAKAEEDGEKQEG